ncbi:MAG: cation diffusion facilitator family transporter, partial [Phycisphaerae bacterium]|nr:cation diffusion facilitator family transporter [Phycisphaerae bacterium]
AAILLTAIKIVVGILTGSLGILAEAAHSGLDLVAAVITFLAVRFADRPADEQHAYGHGKIENFSALVETLLLLGTCAWIIMESVERLWFKKVHVEATAWAFAVMTVSIVVDWSRSRMLYRAARKHRSQALEADALHFATDIWSSLVVLGGLACVVASDVWPRVEWLGNADAVAALGVAIIVIVISYRLGRRTVEALLDAHLPDEEAWIKQLLSTFVPAIHGFHRMRSRKSGASRFFDFHIFVNSRMTVADSHRLAHQIAERIQQHFEGSNVTVHVEPCSEECVSCARTGCLLSDEQRNKFRELNQPVEHG